MMARAKIILKIKVNKLFHIFVEFLQKKLKTCSPYFCGVIATLVEVCENSKSCGNTRLLARVSTAFLVPRNFHLCFYNDRNAVYIFSTT